MNQDAPVVSVVVPVHNAMPYLLACLDSVVRQSIGADRLEVVAVDDGSTDGSAETLDKYAADHPGLFRVVHQEASGTPAAPRNVGIELARGEYVFFLDADDYLDERGLEHMVDLAEANGSDVVLGKMASVGGRGTPQSMFTRTQPRADLYDSRVYWTLGPWKLFRRSMLIDHDIRFPQDRRGSEDQPFTFRAYFHARNISVAADRVCYYIVEREDGGNLTRGGMQVAEGRRFTGKDTLTEMAEQIAAHVPAGPKRDYLMKRHWEVEGETRLRSLARERDPDEIARRFAVVHEPVQRWYTPGAAALLSPIRRLKYQLVLQRRVEDLIRLERDPGLAVHAEREGRRYLTLPGHETEVGPHEGPWTDITDTEERHRLPPALRRRLSRGKRAAVALVRKAARRVRAAVALARKAVRRVRAAVRKD